MDQLPKTAVLLINTGSPDAPTAEALRSYLDEFLSDRRIVELPRWKWWPILHCIILRKRPAKSAARYRGVWTEDGSPLVVNTRRMAEALQKRFADDAAHVTVRWAMRYGNPAVGEVMNELAAAGVERLFVMPMFAQYAPQTSAACLDVVCREMLSRRDMPALRTLHDYHDDPDYIAALKRRIEAFWAEHGRPFDEGGKLLMSFHGVPQKGVDEGDVYEKQCRKTARCLADALGLRDEEWCLAYQSRFGRDAWLKPYALPYVKEMAADGIGRVDVICPGFAADCLETLEEIRDELAEAFSAAYREKYGKAGVCRYIPALNDSVEAVDAYERIVRRELAGWLAA